MDIHKSTLINKQTDSYLRPLNLPRLVKIPSQSVRDLPLGSTTAALDILAPHYNARLDFPPNLHPAWIFPRTTTTAWTSMHINDRLDFPTRYNACMDFPCIYVLHGLPRASTHCPELNFSDLNPDCWTQNCWITCIYVYKLHQRIVGCLGVKYCQYEW